MKKNKWFYGIRKKMVIFTLLVAIFPLGVTGMILAFSINRNITELNLENYSYSSGKMSGNYEVMLREFDVLTRNCITNPYIQKSLTNDALTPQEKVYLRRSLWYSDNRNTKYGLFVDNKGNAFFYNTVIPNTRTEDILSKEMRDALAGSYAETIIKYGTISLNAYTDTGVFLMRNIRHIERNLKPGVLIVRLNDVFYENIFSGVIEHPLAAYAVVSTNGDVCFRQGGDGSGSEFNEDMIRKIKEELPAKEGEPTHFSANGRIYFANTDKNRDFIFLSVLPETVLREPLRDFLKKLGLTMLLSAALCVLVSSLLSHTFRDAIRKISHEMKHFDGETLNRRIEIETNTELDQMLAAYNKMLLRVDKLMKEIKKEQEELRINEYNSLVYQINPHFLYNTLDNIHMLARMDRDETMVKLIQSLSKMLRISISKGEDDVTVRDELEHVRCYLNIERIRNGDLFRFEIEAEEELLQVKIPKIILQPIAENSIKYGFAEMDDGGQIDISVKADGENLAISVANNGSAIEPGTLEKLNQMQYQDPERIKQTFPKKKGGYGVSNVVSRLCIRYGNRFRMYYESSEESGTVCHIRIPLRSEISGDCKQPRPDAQDV